MIGLDLQGELSEAKEKTAGELRLWELVSRDPDPASMMAQLEPSQVVQDRLSECMKAVQQAGRTAASVKLLVSKLSGIRELAAAKVSSRERAGRSGPWMEL